MLIYTLFAIVFSIRNKDQNPVRSQNNRITYVANRISLTLCMYFRSCGIVLLSLDTDAGIIRAEHNTGDTGRSKAEINLFRYKQGFVPESRPLERKDRPTPRPQQHHHTVIKNTATVDMHRRG
jgi:hypothetical protein